MSMFVSAFLLFAATVPLVALTIVIAGRSGLGHDNRAGVQRFHEHRVSRLGGIPIAGAFATWIATAGFAGSPTPESILLIAAVVPAFFAGLSEDVTHKVGAGARLALTMIGAAFAWIVLDVRVISLGQPAVDAALEALPILSLLVTMLFVGGAAHALNIVDGYNGLAGSYVMLVLAAILTVALRVDDAQVAMLAAGLLAVTAAFFMFNFPYGKIFLGDGGSYLLGTMLAFLLVMLVHRNPAEVSPWFAALLLIYPVWETLFSMYRKMYLRGESAMQPDGVHLHMLVYKRLVRSNTRRGERRQRVLMNSTTSVYFAAGNLAVALFAVAYSNDTLTLMAGVALAIVAYGIAYAAVVKFRARRLSVRSAWGKPGRARTAYESAL